jgi:glycosyltransferase involved in cell wall biosynthesis
MKIFRVIARLNVGGPARHVVWLTDGLKRRGYAGVLVAGVVPRGEDDMGHVAEEAGLTPIILPQMGREISLKDPIAAWKLYRLMVRERPDIVHTHTAKAGSVGRVAGMMYRWLTPAALIGRPRTCKLVHTYHGHVFHSYYGPLKTKIFLTVERMLARLATDRIVVISEQQRSEIHETFRVGRREQFQVVPLGIDVDAFSDWQQRRSRLRDELGFSETDHLVGIVGRLTEVKNHEMFLKVAARLKELSESDGNRHVRVRYLIIGDGNLRHNLEAQARVLGLTDDVIFPGTRDDREFFYPALDVVALTSLNEGTPLTLIEAMANARPVISTIVGGVVDLLGNCFDSQIEGYKICERGLGVRSNDVESFAHGLKFLLENESERQLMGSRGRAFVEQRYSKDRLVTDMIDLYESLAGEAHRVAPKQSEEMRVL